jgi:hypothetical protein
VREVNLGHHPVRIGVAEGGLGGDEIVRKAQRTAARHQWLEPGVITLAIDKTEGTLPQRQRAPGVAPGPAGIAQVERDAREADVAAVELASDIAPAQPGGEVENGEAAGGGGRAERDRDTPRAHHARPGEAHWSAGEAYRRAAERAGQVELGGTGGDAEAAPGGLHDRSAARRAQPQPAPLESEIGILQSVEPDVHAIAPQRQAAAGRPAPADRERQPARPSPRQRAAGKDPSGKADGAVRPLRDTHLRHREGSIPRAVGLHRQPEHGAAARATLHAAGKLGQAGAAHRHVAGEARRGASEHRFEAG